MAAHALQMKNGSAAQVWELAKSAYSVAINTASGKPHVLAVFNLLPRSATMAKTIIAMAQSMNFAHATTRALMQVCVKMLEEMPTVSVWPLMAITMKRSAAMALTIIAMDP
jgi:hypothetical protein